MYCLRNGIMEEQVTRKGPAYHDDIPNQRSLEGGNRKDDKDDIQGYVHEEKEDERPHWSAIVSSMSHGTVRGGVEIGHCDLIRNGPGRRPLATD